MRPALNLVGLALVSLGLVLTPSLAVGSSNAQQQVRNFTILNGGIVCSYRDDGITCINRNEDVFLCVETGCVSRPSTQYPERLRPYTSVNEEINIRNITCFTRDLHVWCGVVFPNGNGSSVEIGQDYIKFENL